MIELRKAGIEDCLQIYNMQVISFRPLLDKYNDTQTNPAAESSDRIMTRMNQSFTDYYLITAEEVNIGAVRVARMDNCNLRISPMFILPQYQGRGYAQQTLIEVEKLYPDAVSWSLDTIKEEPKLCHLYEKMGYVRTGEEKRIGDNMTLVFYRKAAAGSGSKDSNTVLASCGSK